MNEYTDTRCVPFSIQVYHGQGEVDDGPEDKVVGITLDGRYRNVLLDIRPNRSCPTRNLDAQADRIAAARARITEAFPIYQHAQLIVKDVFC